MLIEEVIKEKKAFLTKSNDMQQFEKHVLARVEDPETELDEKLSELEKLNRFYEARIMREASGEKQ